MNRKNKHAEPRPMAGWHCQYCHISKVSVTVTKRRIGEKYTISCVCGKHEPVEASSYAKAVKKWSE